MSSLKPRSFLAPAFAAGVVGVALACGGSAGSGAGSGGVGSTANMGGTAAGSPAAGGSAGSGGLGGSSGGGSGGSSGSGGVGSTANNGGAAGSPAAGGSAGAGGNMTMLTPPLERDGHLVLEFGQTLLQVDPAVGGRVISLKAAGIELLTGPGVDPANYGSTFWPSPQSAWGWPPPPEIDNQPYEATVAAEGFTVSGPSNAALGLSVAKTFTADLAHEAIDVTYTMRNTGTAAVSFAPWEISRVPAAGIAFWPTGTAPVAGANELLVSTEVAGHTWVDPAATAGEAKLFADGSGGWLAYVANGVIFIKQFEDNPATASAPGEAEIEVYVNPAHTYVEIEPQGRYGAIDPGQSVSWKVTWFARALPAGVAAEVGNPDLIAFVTQTLK